MALLWWWLVVAYGLLTTVVAVAGLLLGDATGWLFATNLSAIYWLAPAPVLLALALLGRRWLAAAACATGAVVWLTTFGPLFAPQQTPDGDALRVVSFNAGVQPEIDHVARLVARTVPDVLLLQEILPDTQDALVEQLPSLPFHHFAPVNTAAPGGGGTAVFSRRPILGARPVDGLLDLSRPSDVVEIDGDDGPFSVVSVHLASSCGECVHTTLNASPMTGLSSQSQRRIVEADAIARALPSDGPTIVAGDFNSSTLNEPRRRLLDDNLVDVHRTVGSGPGFTRFRTTGLVRIDWILASRDITPVREWVDRRDGSDHRPVVADVILP